MGTDDPRLDAYGNIDFRLRRQFTGYKRQDPPPDRVKPIPVQIIRHLLAIAHSMANDGNQAVADMITLAYFFLLCPGEYTTTTDNRPFYLEDIELWIGQQRFSSLNILLADLP